MPWYNNPVIICKVLNRIATRYPNSNLQDLNTTLDNATQLLWSKQERYCKSKSSAEMGASSLTGVNH